MVLGRVSRFCFQRSGLEMHQMRRVVFVACVRALRPPAVGFVAPRRGVVVASEAAAAAASGGGGGGAGDAEDFDFASPVPEAFEYLSVIEGGETYTREFKTCQYDPPLRVMKEKVSKYVNAFANSGGGEIYFGVDDDGAVSGCVLTAEDATQVTRLVDGATQRVDPMLDADAVRSFLVPVEGAGAGPDRYVVVVRVKRGCGEPVSFRGGTTSNFFSRGVF